MPRKPRNNGGNPQGGRIAHAPTSEQRSIVAVLIANGIDEGTIAREIRISEPTLRKHYKEEIAHGFSRVKAGMVTQVVRKGLKGDNACMFFWLKTRGGFSEVQKHEVAGANGRPLDPPILVVNFVRPPQDGEPIPEE